MFNCTKHTMVKKTRERRYILTPRPEDPGSTQTYKHIWIKLRGVQKATSEARIKNRLWEQKSKKFQASRCRSPSVPVAWDFSTYSYSKKVSRLFARCGVHGSDGTCGFSEFLTNFNIKMWTAGYWEQRELCIFLHMKKDARWVLGLGPYILAIFQQVIASGPSYSTKSSLEEERISSTV